MVRKNAKILLEQALLLLLNEQTLDQIDVQDIAQVANLSRQTFYYNFKNKQDMLCWIMEKDVQLALDAFRHSGELYDYIYRSLLTIKDKAILYRSIDASDSRRRSYISYFENGLLSCAKMIEDRSILGRMGSDLRDSLHLFTYGVSGMMQHWVETGLQQDPHQLADIIIANMPPAVDRYFHGNQN